MSHLEDLIAVLDANVLYPQWLRDVMLTLAAFGYYEPRWSRQIIDEMRRNVLANHPAIDPRRFEDATITALHSAFPEAWIDPPDELITTMDNATRRPPRARHRGCLERPPRRHRQRHGLPITALRRVRPNRG